MWYCEILWGGLSEEALGRPQAGLSESRAKGGGGEGQGTVHHKEDRGGKSHHR